jgi:copper oxidase (laccase) domain-containing protein
MCIRDRSYPVSAGIREEMLGLSPEYEQVFTAFKPGEYLMDIYEVARMQLTAQGVLPDRIDGAEWNTFTDRRFHSARRDKELSGRMVTLVWME